MNEQPIEKRVALGASTLQVHSIFYTIQGEGPFCGEPAVFVRLTGCNLQCPACDTDYTSKRYQMTPLDVWNGIRNEHISTFQPIVVITGGEPFRQDLYALCLLLVNDGYTVQIETNGTLPLSAGLEKLCRNSIEDRGGVFVVCSPKTGSVNKILQPYIFAYKYVMRANSVRKDGLPVLALNHSASPFVARPPGGFGGKVYLQPCDDKDEIKNRENLEAVVAASLEHGYTVQLQVHKLLGVE